MDFYQDFDSGSVDAIMFPLVGSSTVSVIVRPSTAVASSTNPQYTVTAFMENFTPVAGNVGEVMMSPVRFSAGEGNLSRVTT